MSQFPFNLQDFDIQPLKWFNNFFFTTTHIPTTTCLFHLISFFFFQAGGGNNRDKLLAEAFWQMDACNSISKLLATSSNDLWKRPCPKAFVNSVTKMGHFPHFPKNMFQYFRETINLKNARWTKKNQPNYTYFFTLWANWTRSDPNLDREGLTRPKLIHELG